MRPFVLAELQRCDPASAYVLSKDWRCFCETSTRAGHARLTSWRSRVSRSLLWAVVVDRNGWQRMPHHRAGLAKGPHRQCSRRAAYIPRLHDGGGSDVRAALAGALDKARALGRA